jgi:hypothetical protein
MRFFIFSCIVVILCLVVIQMLRFYPVVSLAYIAPFGLTEL